MFRPRIIPVLLLKNKGLVKSINFKNHNYIGDPINAVKIFNHLKADELVFLDIEASAKNKLVDLDLVKNIGEEANMPFAVGGGIKTINDIKKIINVGAEKVIINSQAILNPNFISEASETFGSSTIVVCIDVKKTLLRKEQIWIINGTKATGYLPVDFAKLMQEKGAGEIIIQSIEQDGKMAGYDIELIKKISTSVSIPVIALGGAGHLSHLKQAYQNTYVNGLACGSLFVYQGSKKGVLINYPNQNQIKEIRT